MYGEIILGNKDVAPHYIPGDTLKTQHPTSQNLSRNEWLVVGALLCCALVLSGFILCLPTPHSVRARSNLLGYIETLSL